MFDNENKTVKVSSSPNIKEHVKAITISKPESKNEIIIDIKIESSLI